MDIGQEIYLKRLDIGMTQQQLATKAGLAQGNLSNIERGKSDLTVGLLRRIALVLGVSTASLFESVQSPIDEDVYCRSRLESIAQYISGESTAMLSAKDCEIATLIKIIMPRNRNEPIQEKKVNLAWMRLNKLLKKKIILTIVNRVQKSRQRYETKTN